MPINFLAVQRCIAVGKHCVPGGLGHTVVVDLRGALWVPHRFWKNWPGELKAVAKVHCLDLALLGLPLEPGDEQVLRPVDPPERLQADAFLQGGRHLHIGSDRLQPEVLLEGRRHSIPLHPSATLSTPSPSPKLPP
eukprot:3022693-Pyramimonas_sp.AAC.1